MSGRSLCNDSYQRSLGFQGQAEDALWSAAHAKKVEILHCEADSKPIYIRHRALRRGVCGPRKDPLVPGPWIPGPWILGPWIPGPGGLKAFLRGRHHSSYFVSRGIASLLFHHLFGHRSFCHLGSILGGFGVDFGRILEGF